MCIKDRYDQNRAVDCRQREAFARDEAAITKRSVRKNKHNAWQYSRIENAKIEPSVSTLEKLAKVFGVAVPKFFKPANPDDELNLPVMEKIKLIDTLAKDE